MVGDIEAYMHWAVWVVMGNAQADGRFMIMAIAGDVGYFEALSCSCLSHII